MPKLPSWLFDFSANVYSQTGEDGIIAKILEVLPVRDRWCVEFGAWDGVHLSNTANLIRNQGYGAVLIEGDAAKYQELVKNYAGNPRVLGQNDFVGFMPENNLDRILQKTPVPTDFDFLSIDIDGNDYHVWRAVAAYTPKLVCIEFNPTIPTGLNFVQPANMALKQGSSLSSIVSLAKEKNYELVSVMPWNAFFVKAEFFPLFEIGDNRPEVLRTNLEAVTYIFSGYDGKIFLAGNRKLPWHGVELNENRLQVLPRWLRKYPADYTRSDRLFRLLTNPREFITRALRPLRWKGQ